MTYVPSFAERLTQAHGNIYIYICLPKSKYLELSIPNPAHRISEDHRNIVYCDAAAAATAELFSAVTLLCLLLRGPCLSLLERTPPVAQHVHEHEGPPRHVDHEDNDRYEVPRYSDGSNTYGERVLRSLENGGGGKNGKRTLKMKGLLTGSTGQDMIN